MKKLFDALMIFMLTSNVNGQVKIGTNPSVVNPFSLLELEGSQKGLLLPRIATATDLALMSGAPEGMVVYSIPDASLYVKQSSAWVKISSDWGVNGNHIYNTNLGNVGIRTSSPGYPLTLKSNNIGFSQESGDGSVKVGFYTENGFGAYLQTHSNHDLQFSTNNGGPQMILKTNGNVGIRNTTPNAALAVGRGTGLDGTAALFGSTHVTHFNYDVAENTYIRAGKDNGYVVINDIPGARVAIGMNNPTRAMVEQNGAVGNNAAIFGGEGSGLSLQRSSPAIGFNQYLNGANNKSISPGYSSQLGLDEADGTMFVKIWSSFSPIFDASLSGAANLKKFFINRFGKVGIGSSSTFADPALPDLYISQSNITTSSGYDRSHGLSFGYNAIIGDPASINLSIGDLVDGPTWQNALKIFGFPNGGPVAIIHPNTGQYIQLSDRGAKKDIALLEENTLNKLLQLKPSFYHMANDKEGAKYKYGFISQEVENIFPDMVFTSGTYKMLSYESFIPVAIKGIQEQQQQIDDLKKEIAELKKLILSKNNQQ